MTVVSKYTRFLPAAFTMKRPSFHQPEKSPFVGYRRAREPSACTRDSLPCASHSRRRACPTAAGLFRSPSPTFPSSATASKPPTGGSNVESTARGPPKQNHAPRICRHPPHLAVSRTRIRSARIPDPSDRISTACGNSRCIAGPHAAARGFVSSQLAAKICHSMERMFHGSSI